jgi:hypothetical protein
MNELLIICSSVLSMISPLVYIRAILKGEAKPHRTTRLVLLIIVTIASITLWINNDRVAFWLALVSMFQSILVFIISLSYGVGGKSKVDIISLFIAFTGILLWQITDNPVLALYFSIGADFAGMVPTLIKTYRHPESEYAAFFLIDTVAAFLNILAVEKYELANLIFPVYILLINLLMSTVIYVGNRDK